MKTQDLVTFATEILSVFVRSTKIKYDEIARIVYESNKENAEHKYSDDADYVLHLLTKENIRHLLRTHRIRLNEKVLTFIHSEVHALVNDLLRSTLYYYKPDMIKLLLKDYYGNESD